MILQKMIKMARDPGYDREVYKAMKDPKVIDKLADKIIKYTNIKKRSR